MNREIRIEILANAVKQVTGGKLFSIKAEASGTTALISIVGDIGDWKNSSERFKEAVDEIVAKGIVDIEGYINTFGGDTFDAFEINNILDRFTGTAEICRTGAVCASAGTIIAARFNNVISAPNTQWMYHKPWTRVEGNEDELESAMNLLKNVTKSMIDLYIKKTGKSEAYIKNLIAKDNWMTPTQAKQHGFVNQIGDQLAVDASDIINIKACYKELPPEIAAALQVAIPKNSPEKLTPNKDTKMELKILAAQLGLNPETATQAEVDAKIKDNAEKAALYERMTQSNKEAEEAEKAIKIKNAIDGAILAKKTTDTTENRELFTKIGITSGVEALEKVLAEMKAPAKPTAGLPNGKQENDGRDDQDRENWTYQDWQEKDRDGLIAMAKKDEPKFNKLHAAYAKGNKKK